MLPIRNNLKKKDIAELINAKLGLPTSLNKKIIDDLIQILIVNLISFKQVKISNFGTFFLRKKNKRIGRNPKNNKSYEISERNVVTFNNSDDFKITLNNNE